MEKNEIVTLPGAKSLADGISVKTPGDIAFKYIKEYVDEVVTVTEDEIAYGIFELIEKTKVIAEGAGASTVAALLANKINIGKGKKVVALISGGNIDIAMISKIIDRQLIMLKRRMRFKVELQDKVGEFEDVISNIVSMGANIVKARQDTNWSEKGLEYANVIFEVEVQSKEQGDKLLKQLREKGYNIQTNICL